MSTLPDENVRFARWKETMQLVSSSVFFITVVWLTGTPVGGVSLALRINHVPQIYKDVSSSNASDSSYQDPEKAALASELDSVPLGHKTVSSNLNFVRSVDSAPSVSKDLTSAVNSDPSASTLQGYHTHAGPTAANTTMTTTSVSLHVDSAASLGSSLSQIPNRLASMEPGGAISTATAASDGSPFLQALVKRHRVKRILHPVSSQSHNDNLCNRVCRRCKTLISLQWSSRCWKQCLKGGDVFTYCLIATSDTN